MLSKLTVYIPGSFSKSESPFGFIGIIYITYLCNSGREAVKLGITPSVDMSITRIIVAATLVAQYDRKFLGCF